MRWKEAILHWIANSDAHFNCLRMKLHLVVITFPRDNSSFSWNTIKLLGMKSGRVKFYMEKMLFLLAENARSWYGLRRKNLGKGSKYTKFKGH